MPPTESSSNLPVIRVAGIVDASALLMLQKTAFAQEARNNGVEEIPPLVQTLESFVAELPHHVVLGVVVSDRWVGMIRGREKEGTLYIGRLAVEPSMQGRGIGRMLLEEMESRFPNVTRFEIFTGARSERNIRLYTKAGYRIFRTKTGTPDLVFMEKVVGS